MIQVVKRTVDKMRRAGFSGEFFIYRLLHGDIRECVDRVLELQSYDKKLYVHEQPCLDLPVKIPLLSGRRIWRNGVTSE